MSSSPTRPPFFMGACMHCQRSRMCQPCIAAGGRSLPRSSLGPLRPQTPRTPWTPPRRAPSRPSCAPSAPLHALHSSLPSAQVGEFDHTVPLRSVPPRPSVVCRVMRTSGGYPEMRLHAASTPHAPRVPHKPLTLISESIRANVRAYCVPRLRTLVSSAQSSYEPYLAAEA